MVGLLKRDKLVNVRSLKNPKTNFSLNFRIQPDNSLPMGELTPELDRIDLRILNVLQADGRISNLKLAEAVALSPTAVLARTQRLQREGYILGYEARLNPLKLGRGMLVFVEVLLDRTTPNVFNEFKVAVQVRDEILECHMVAGGFDYLIKTRMADMAAFRDFAGRVLWQLPGVRETRTYAVMEEVKHSSRLPL
jgi:Lrp/AsnC family leucine-responsive transcriptional regulator